MKLSPQLTIDSIEYASQGNAMLGIRNSGKSYSATFLAERLMDDGIPFIAFDPIGIWRNLKVGKKGPGYPVVVAGDDGDLPLTAQSAPDIVRAAMKENVSLVVDLYSMKLSKADWKSIVEQCIRLLLYENKTCGLRHIFIEEAAEFVPQRVQPGDGRVYAEIEKLARMGGNASLGYTLINQRAEEVNKAVLELCDCLFLHRQKGRHSLTALGKWLDVADTKNAKEIINSLPSLEQGECWVWLQGSHDPIRLRVPEKRTVHPDRKNPLAASAGITSDVSTFVERMNHSLSAQATKADTPAKKGLTAVDPRPERVAELLVTIAQRNDAIKELQEALRQSNAIIEQIGNLALAVPVPDIPVAFAVNKRKTVPVEMTESAAAKVSGTVTGGGAMRMLKAAAMFHPTPISRNRMAVIARISSGSGSFRTYLGTLRREGLITNEGDLFQLTAAGVKAAGAVDPLPTKPDELVALWCDIIGREGGAARILRILADKYPNPVHKAEIGRKAQISPTSGSFRTYLGTLRRYKLIEGKGELLKAAEELYN